MKIRLSKAAREFNISISTIREFLAKKGFQVNPAPNTKLTPEMYELLVKEYQSEKDVKNESRKKVNLSYKGCSVSVKSTLFEGKDILTVKKPTDGEIEINVLLSHLIFGANNISIKIGSIEFLLWENGISPYLNSIKMKSYAKILLNYSNFTFKFLDSSLLSFLKNESTRLEDIERQKEQKENNNEKKTEKINDTKFERKIKFSKIKFGYSSASITYKSKQYVFLDQSIKDFYKIISLLYTKDLIKSVDRFMPIWVIFDNETSSFAFKDIDIHKYINHLNEVFLSTEKQFENRKRVLSQNKDTSLKHSSTSETLILESENIRFYNGYYIIFRTCKGEKDNSILPYKVEDPNSHEVLNLVHKYFEQKFEQMHIFVKYDKTKILDLSRFDLLQLNNYVSTLKRNLSVKGEWWEEIQNNQKPSLKQCSNISAKVVKKKMALKNAYLDNLAVIQNENILLSVYEVNHGKEEDAFIFSVDMPHKRCAIIFENAAADASTATWVFIAKNENYETCVNKVFDYFTDYSLSSKRSSLRNIDANPPYKFNAESYSYIDHNDLEQWLKKLSRIIENNPHPADIAFVPGLNIPNSSEIRVGHGDSITTRNLHNQLMRKLYDRLCYESGKDNVGTEIRVGTKRIDAVVKGKNFYDIYEIKTSSNPFDCVTEALGQLCQYAYLFCRDKIGKMVIVGASETTKEVEQYLSTLRKNHSLQLYYINV